MVGVSFVRLNYLTYVSLNSACLASVFESNYERIHRKLLDKHHYRSLYLFNLTFTSFLQAASQT